MGMRVSPKGQDADEEGGLCHLMPSWSGPSPFSFTFLKQL